MTSFEQRAFLAGVLALVAGCTAEHYSRRAERVADDLVKEGEQNVLGDREATVRQPDPQPAPAADSAAPSGAPSEPSEAPPPEEPAPTVLDLRRALAIAYSTNRDMIARREDLQVQALSLASSRHDFAPQLAMTLGYLLAETANGPHVESGTAAFSLSQILPTGADLSVRAGGGGADDPVVSYVFDSFVSLSLAQPLLRGGGYAVTHEPLIQAERDLVYAIRNFELFREDFSIDVARRYYDLVNQKQSIENQERNLENNEFGRRQADALFAVGRAAELDVLRARRSELNARNDLLEAQENVALALANFRIFLGLPEGEPVDVEPEAPAFVPIAYDNRTAVEVALANRLDLLNRQEQLEDSERGLRLARNSLLPDLDLELSTRYATQTSESFGGSDLDRGDTSLALTFGVPLDRVRERNSYRSNEISLERARRDLEQFEDTIRVSIQSSFRELTRRLKSLEINRQLIEDQTKNLRIAELRFERGDLNNRDVVEANQSLLDAQNAFIDEQVNYEITRLQLLRDLGILFIDETGMWKN